MCSLLFLNGLVLFVSTLPLYGTPIRRFAPPSSTEAVERGYGEAKDEGLCLNANELLAGVSDLGGPLSARDGYSSSLATEACFGVWPSKTL